MRLIFLFTPYPCWELDISDNKGNPLVCGIPLITGADLLAQYGYLNFGAQMYCATDVNHDIVPQFFDLGIDSHLYLAA